MGSYNIIRFLLLVGFLGLVSLMSILIRSALVDASNVIIGQGMLSVDTVNTLTTILTILQWAPVICIVALAVWAISGAINKQDNGDDE